MDCGICMLTYDLAAHEPRSLMCGHTVCKTCLENITRISRAFRCPWDRKEDRRNISDIPQNRALTESLQLEQQAAGAPAAAAQPAAAAEGASAAATEPAPVAATAAEPAPARVAREPSAMNPLTAPARAPEPVPAAHVRANTRYTAYGTAPPELQATTNTVAVVVAVVAAIILAPTTAGPIAVMVMLWLLVARLISASATMLTDVLGRLCRLILDTVLVVIIHTISVLWNLCRPVFTIVLAPIFSVLWELCQAIVTTVLAPVPDLWKFYQRIFPTVSAVLTAATPTTAEEGGVSQVLLLLGTQVLIASTGSFTLITVAQASSAEQALVHFVALALAASVVCESMGYLYRVARLLMKVAVDLLHA